MLLKALAICLRDPIKSLFQKVLEIVHLVVNNLIGRYAALAGLKTGPILLSSLETALDHHLQVLLPLLYSSLGQDVVTILLELVLQRLITRDHGILNGCILMRVWPHAV